MEYFLESIRIRNKQLHILAVKVELCVILSLLSNDRQMIANLKLVSPLYYKNSIIKVLFDYIKYLIVYHNIIIIIHIQQHLICTANNKSVKRGSKRLSK